jgi:prevent-host-death family protein
MTIVTIHEAKTNLSKLLKLVEAGEEVVIARGSVHVAKLSPVKALEKKTRNLGYGMFAHLPPIPNNFFSDPLSEDELAAWEGKYSFDP